MSRTRQMSTATVLGVVLAGSLGSVANAATTGGLSVSKAELRGSQLRLEGTTLPGSSFVSVESTTSAVGARPDAGGTFRAASDTLTAPDCRVTVNDFRNPVQTVTLTGCRTSLIPPTTPAPPSGTCVLTPQSTPTALTAGTRSVFWFFASGCAPSSPLQYSGVAGAIPTGMSLGGFQSSPSGNVIGVPKILGRYVFTVQVTDAAGATDQESFTIDAV